MQLISSELPISLKDKINKRYGPEAVNEFQNFQGNALEVEFTFDKVQNYQVYI